MSKLFLQPEEVQYVAAEGTDRVRVKEMERGLRPACFTSRPFQKIVEDSEFITLQLQIFLTQQKSCWFKSQRFLRTFGILFDRTLSHARVRALYFLNF